MLTLIVSFVCEMEYILVPTSYLDDGCKFTANSFAL